LRRHVVSVSFILIAIVSTGLRSAEGANLGQILPYLSSSVPGDVLGALFFSTETFQKLGSLKAFKPKPEEERAREILDSVLKEVKGEIIEPPEKGEGDGWGWLKSFLESVDLLGIVVFIDLPAPLTIGHIVDKGKIEDSMAFLERTLEESYGEIRAESNSFGGLEIRSIYTGDGKELFWTIQEDFILLWGDDGLTDKILMTFSGDFPSLANNKKFSNFLSSIPPDADVFLLLDLPFLLSTIPIESSLKEALGRMDIGGLASYASISPDGIRDWIGLDIGKELIAPISDLLSHRTPFKFEGISDILGFGIAGLIAVSFDDLNPIWDLARSKSLSPAKLTILQMRLGFKVSDLMKSLGPRVAFLISRKSVGAMVKRIIETGDISEGIKAALGKGSALAFEVRDKKGLDEILRKLKDRSEIPAPEGVDIVHVRIPALPNPGNIMDIPSIEFYYMESPKWFVISRDPNALLPILSPSAELGNELAGLPSKLRRDEVFDLVYLDGPEIGGEIWDIWGKGIRSAFGGNEDEWRKAMGSLPKVLLSFDLSDSSLQILSFSPIGGVGTSLILLSLLFGYTITGGI
jgi:hypothetical protein